MDCIAVIPCHNEAASIGPLVRAALLHVPKVIVVDDGSTDATAILAEAAGAEVLRLTFNQGKGAAVQQGLLRARGLGSRWALLLDGDGQHAPDDIPAFLQSTSRDAAELIVGNRMLRPTGMPLVRRITNRTMSAILSWLTGTSLPDTQCGFRLIRLDAWTPLSANCTRFEVESELLLASLAAGHRVTFIPIQCRYTVACSQIDPVVDTGRWLRWLWRAQPRFTAARARRFGRNHLALGVPSKAPYPPTKDPLAPPAPQSSNIRKAGRIVARIAGFLFLGYLMGAAMDWSARRSLPERPAGFWWGMAHGALMPASLPTLATGRDVIIYAPHNTGIPYKLGYTMGVNGAGLLFFGLAFWKPKSHRNTSTSL